MLLSVVIPCHNEQEMVLAIWRELVDVLGGMHMEDGLESEIIYVDDGSTDATLSLLRGLAADPYKPLDMLKGSAYAGGKAPYVPAMRYISFSRNFGKEAALSAGLDAANGDYVAVMDADMQDPPCLLPQMRDALSSGECDVAAARRVTRKGEPAIRSASARLFYSLLNRMSKTQVADGARDFRMMTRPVVDAVLSMPERNRFSKGMFSWVGFRTEWIEYENVERAAGETSWSFWGLVRYSMDALTSFSATPLVFSSVIGFAMSLVAFVILVFIVVKTLAFGDPVSGWPSLACLIMFVGGVQLLCIGILGQYLAKTYLETKQRPLYLVAERGATQEPSESRPGSSSAR